MSCVMLQRSAHCATSARRCKSSPYRSVSTLRAASEDVSTSSSSSLQQSTSSSSTRTVIPRTPEQQVTQAIAAVTAAWRDGINRQRLDLLLPLIGATDLDDWPGGIRQQFKAAAPLVESILRGVKQEEGLQGPLQVEIWDQGDAVGAWSGDKLAAVLFPTAGTLKRLRGLAERKPNAPELLIVINPQYELTGGLVNDFTFMGAEARKSTMQLLDSFQPTYTLKQLRVYGDDTRLLRAHPSPWQLSVVDKQGGAQLLSTSDSKPEYKDIEATLRAWPEARMNQSLADRLRSEWNFGIDSLKQPPQK